MDQAEYMTFLSSRAAVARPAETDAMLASEGPAIEALREVSNEEALSFLAVASGVAHSFQTRLGSVDRNGRGAYFDWEDTEHIGVVLYLKEGGQSTPMAPNPRMLLAAGRVWQKMSMAQRMALAEATAAHSVGFPAWAARLDQAGQEHQESECGAGPDCPVAEINAFLNDYADLVEKYMTGHAN